MALAAGLMLAISAAAEATAGWRWTFAASNGVLLLTAIFAWRREVSLPVIVGVGVVLRLMVLPVGPTLSDDVWRYLWDGLVTSGGGNPYLHRPTDPDIAALQRWLASDRLNSGDYFSVYPPVSQLAFLLPGIAIRLFDSAVAGLVTFKLITFASELLAMLLLARLAADGSRTKAAFALYAWNPLIVIETAQMHSEALLLPLLAGTLLATTRGRWTMAGILLAAAVWTKLYPLLLLPLVWRRGGWRALVASIVTLVVLALPFAHRDVPGNVMESLQLYTGFFEFYAAPYFLLKTLFVTELNDGGDRAAMVLRSLLVVGTLLIYLIDWRLEPRLDATVAAVLGLYIVTATTVHPWYLLPLLSLPIVWQTPRWHWLWLGLIASATYVRYAKQEEAYLTLTWIGWGGWLALLPLVLLPLVLRHRGRGKARRVIDTLHADAGSLLDLGCGEGEVGQALARRGFDVTFADVADFHDDAATPFVRYDGHRLPFANDAFDVVVLYFVLHHCDDAERVLREAVRVGRRVVVVESVYRTPRELAMLTRLDKLANRLRGGWQMAAQEEHLHFRTAAAWRELASEFADVVVLEEHGAVPHRQATLLLQQRQQL